MSPKSAKPAIATGAMPEDPTAKNARKGVAKTKPAVPAVGKSEAERVQDALEKKRTRTVRPFPACSFEEALEFATAMFKFGSGQKVRRVSLFNQLQKSPDSGASRQLITNTNKYGLTEGGYQAEFLSLTEQGIKAVDDELPPREVARARIALAIEQIESFGGLFAKFVGSKLPSRTALVDAIKELKVSEEFAEEGVDTFVVNLRFVGLLQTLSGAERIVTIDHLLDSLPGKVQQLVAAPRTVGPQADPETFGGALVTAAHAEFERTCFYISAIGEEGSEFRKHSDLFLSTLVEPALEAFGLIVVRADAIDKPGVITRQIIDYILRSRLVIADLSFHNPNVFYELALRHAARLPIVQLARTQERLPFDINQMRTIRIDTSDIYSLVPKIEIHRAEIGSQVRRALEAGQTVDNPVSIFYPSLKMVLE